MRSNAAINGRDDAHGLATLTKFVRLYTDSWLRDLGHPCCMTMSGLKKGKIEVLPKGKRVKLNLNESCAEDQLKIG